jgi:hypothetical protein
LCDQRFVPAFVLAMTASRLTGLIGVSRRLQNQCQILLKEGVNHMLVTLKKEKP